MWSCTKIRFTFFNGKKVYTVEYTQSLISWFVFDGNEESNCLEEYKLTKNGKVDYETARGYLDAALKFHPN